MLNEYRKSLAVIELRLWHAQYRLLWLTHDLCIVYVVLYVFLKGHNVHYDQVAWGSLENLTGRETLATVHQTPPSPTAAMMDLEDWCLLQVRKYDFS